MIDRHAKYLLLAAVAVSLLVLSACADPVERDTGPDTNLSGQWDLTMTPDLSTSGTSITCPGSALASSVPLPSKISFFAGGFSGQWHSVRFSHGSMGISGAIPEQKILSLDLGTIFFPVIEGPIVNEGDTITLSYRRQVSADGLGGDFFRAIVVNGPDQLDAEYVYGDMIDGSDRVTTLTFEAKSDNVRIDFIAGLSTVGEYAVVDDVLILDAGGVPILLEDFEDGPHPTTCGPSGGDSVRWEQRMPTFRTSDLCVRIANSLRGLYSARWAGGYSHNISGSVLQPSSFGGLESLIGGGLGGLLGGGNIGAFSGLFMETWEPTITDYLTVYSAGIESEAGIAGTFKGESADHSCIERGLITGARHREYGVDIRDSYWVVTVSGQGTNCSPALVSGNTLPFQDQMLTVTGSTVDVEQIGVLYFGQEPLIDDYGNDYFLAGNVISNIVNVNLFETGGLSTATGVAFLQGGEIIGNVSGSMVFDGGRVCQINDAVFRAELVAKP